jgi:hypothetical protein
MLEIPPQALVNMVTIFRMHTRQNFSKLADETCPGFYTVRIFWIIPTVHI